MRTRTGHTFHEWITCSVEYLEGVLKPYSTAEEKRGARLPTTCSAVCEQRYGLFAGGKMHNRAEPLLKVARQRRPTRARRSSVHAHT